MIHTKVTGRFRYLYLIFAGIFLWTSSYGADANSSAASSVCNAYKSSNALERRIALNSLSEIVPRNGNSVVAEWVSDLLSSALDDKSPVVVSVAVNKIGEFKVTTLSSKMITLFHDADKKYSSAYADRVRFSIIPALGKTGGAGVADLLRNLLAQDNGTVMGEYILLAIRDLNDASLKDAVVQYKTKMQEMVAMGKANNYNPLIYSQMVLYTKYALQVEQSLVKGGK